MMEYKAPSVPKYPSCFIPSATGFSSGWFFMKNENALFTHSKTKLLFLQKNPVNTTFRTLFSLNCISDNWAIFDATITNRLLAMSCLLAYFDSLPKETKTGASMRSGQFFSRWLKSEGPKSTSRLFPCFAFFSNYPKSLVPSSVSHNPKKNPPPRHVPPTLSQSIFPSFSETFNIDIPLPTLTIRIG